MSATTGTICASRIKELVNSTPIAVDPTKPDEKNHLKVDVIMEDGTKGSILTTINQKLDTETIYRYSLGATPKGTALITLKGSVTLPPATDPPPVPGQPKQEAVAPSLRQPAGPMAPVTSKAPAVPDSAPRKGVVKHIRFQEAITMKDDPTKKLYKFVVTFEDGAHGILWGQDENPPLKLGQGITYTYGKIYPDGTKRIDMVPDGSSVDRETIMMRQGCLSAAVQFCGPLGTATHDADTHNLHLNQVLETAKVFEQHILRAAEPVTSTNQPAE